ncbi:MAG: TatD family hydrolase [Patescibacteria group bacterium]|nr:TatD family hydrolase [Patescibacteria group bacterium]
MNPFLIDTHSHLNFSAFKNDAEIIARQCLDQNIWMINVGSQASTSERAVRFAEQFSEGVYAAVGLHPSHLVDMEVEEEEAKFAAHAEDFDHDFYKNLAQSPKVVAIGESGLDYHYVPEHEELNGVKTRQADIFRRHLDLADELNLPIIIHARETYGAVAEIVEEYINQDKLKKRGVLHCFLGTWEEAERFLQFGFLISFTGIVTFAPKQSQIFEHSALAETVKNIPLDRVMVETDAPFLTPEPHRGKRNLPQYVVEVAKKIAEIKGITMEEVAAATTANARNFFGI